MTKKTLVLTLLLSTTVFFSSCHRTKSEFWEDTKTAGRYMNRGLKSLLGRHEDGQMVAWNNSGESESEFHRLTDEDCYTGSLVKEYPLSKESPGDPGSAIPGIDGFSTPSGKLATLFANIHFATDQYTVNGHENLSILEEIASYLASHKKTYVFVEGHADERGSASYNLSLSAKRADSVRAYLIDRGVDPDQLFTISYGKERPFALGHDETSWQQNRRGEFKIYER